MSSWIAEVQVSTYHGCFMLGIVCWTFLVVVTCILTGNPEMVALERLWSCLKHLVYLTFGVHGIIKPLSLCFSHSMWLWFGGTVRVRKRTSHITVGMITFWCSLVTYMNLWKTILRSYLAKNPSLSLSLEKIQKRYQTNLFGCTVGLS